MSTLPIHPDTDEVLWACVRVELDTLREEQKMTDLQTMERANQEMGQKPAVSGGAIHGFINVCKFYLCGYVLYSAVCAVVRRLAQ